MRLALVLDCADPGKLTGFWSAVLGYEAGPWIPPYTTLTDPRGRFPDLLLQQVPEPKSGKNRMHLDIRVPLMEPELERITGLGAELRHGPADDQGWLTAVLADPEGNEFCLLVPPPGPHRNATIDSEEPR